MRRLIFSALLIFFTGTALAQEEPAPPPDYSRDTLFQIFANEVERGETERRFKHEFGAVSFRALGMRWRIGYLPFLMPMPGSRPWIQGERWPDPFLLTGTQIASPPRTWRHQREMSAELRRIEKRLKETAIVKVKPE
jgi:hypothetical protein